MKITCPTCGPDAPRQDFGARSGYALSKCPGCGLVFLSEVEDAINDEFFDDTEDTEAEKDVKDAIEYWSFPQLYDKHRAIFDTFFVERHERLNALKPGYQSLLDVGCGYGLFLDHIKDRVPNIAGIELDPKVAEYARTTYGLTIDTVPVEDYQTDQTFDVVTMCDVLEHLHEPIEILESCRKLLNPGGVLMIQVPNVLGFKLPLNHSWGLPHHIWQFSPPSLKAMLEKAGFDVAAHYTGVMGVVGVYENGGPSLTDHLQWWAGRKLGIGNRLMMFARPK